MADNSEVPLCGKRVFLYPGDPDGTGIIEYNADDYRDSFQDIEFVDSSQFIRSLDQDITLRNRSLLQISDGMRFEVPEYQRNYSWSEDQHEELWDTVRNVISLKTKATKLPSDTYFGTVYIAKSQNRDKYEIIDGQQRLTTIAILLHNIGQALDKLIPEVSGELTDYANHVRQDYIDELLYRRRGPDEVPFITLNDHDNDFFELLFEDDRGVTQQLKRMEQYDGRKQNAIKLRELLDELDIDEETYGPNGVNIDEDVLESFRYYADSHRKLVEANEFYADAIDTYLNLKHFSTTEQKTKALLNLAHFVLRSLRVSECLFETSDQELRISVFQSLNDRGVELSKMDKVRARIVGRFQGESDSETQVGRWESVVEEFGGDSDAVEDFLAHYLAATEKEFNTVTDAKNELLEAFRLKEVGRTQIKSRLASPGEARDFLEELREYAARYQEIINSDLVDDEKKLKKEYREECESILRRLNGLNTSQWRPFVMYIYQEVTETPGKDEFLRDVLKTVENITFRVAISPHVATVVDNTYPKTAQKFRELEQSGNQFDAEKIAEELIDNIDSNARNVFGENFADHLISKSWKNNQTKQLFLKLADEDFREQNRTGITNTWLSQQSNEVHVEHVFPQNFLLRNKANSYAWLEHFFQANGQNRIASRIDQLKTKDAAMLSADDSGYDEIEPILTRIEEDFIRDLGNIMLLDQKVNKSLQNRLFAVKLREYYNNHEKDLDNIANKYFSRDGAVPANELDKILSIDIPDDETVSSTSNVVQEFNSWWTYERAIERKTQLVEAILKSLTFETDEDEFETVMGNIEQMVEDDYETRFMLLSS